MKIDKLFSSLKSHKKLKVLMAPPKLIHPVREWAIGLFGSMILFVGSAAYLGYDFYAQYQKVDEPAVVTNSDVVSYHKKEVPSMLERYRVRESEFNTLRGEGRVVVGTTTPLSMETATSGTSTIASIPLAD